MVVLQPGAPPKPTKQPKEPKRGFQRGGRKPKDAGRRYEHRFATKFNEPDGPTDEKGKQLIHFRRQVGSGAFGKADPGLKGDILGDIVRLRLAFEAKSWDKINGRGEKTVTFPADFLYKIDEEAKTLNRDPIFVYHIKGDEEEWAVVRYSWLHEKLREYELYVYQLEHQLDEALALLPDSTVVGVQ